MFIADSSTMLRECLDRNLFGLPAYMLLQMDAIGRDTAIFLLSSVQP
jgi:hypothetical protein